jgi:hypothetical protein
MCLVDGDAQVPDSIVGGIAYLEKSGVVIQAGLAYNADASLLDAYSPNAEIRNKFKNVLRVGFQVAGTRDMWCTGDYDGFTNLRQWQQREVKDAYAVLGLKTGYFEAFVDGSYNKAGGVGFRHFQPFPAVLTSVLREIRLGDS